MILDENWCNQKKSIMLDVTVMDPRPEVSKNYEPLNYSIEEEHCDRAHWSSIWLSYHPHIDMIIYPICAMYMCVMCMLG
jgi:hypothetical protein